jgi:hypothetical protein
MSAFNKKLIIIPAERNGPKGISDLIVRLSGKSGKRTCVLSFLSVKAAMEKNAPIQKANITAENPTGSPKKNPSTVIYFTSPNPSQRPRETRKIRRNGSVTAMPERIRDKGKAFRVKER